MSSATTPTDLDKVREGRAQKVQGDRKSVGKKIPIIEIFGPVIQGEGAVIGQQTMFIRTGGCDFRCKMCDTMYAVDPHEVKKRSVYMTQQEIVQAVVSLANHTRWVTLSGGNPCMWDLYHLVSTLSHSGKRIAVETQGSIWQPWLHACDVVTVSPKGPGMGEKCDLFKLDVFYERLKDRPGFNLKVVVFNEEDVEFAAHIHSRYRRVPFFISIGNPFVADETGKFAPLLKSGLSEMRNMLLESFDVTSGAVMQHPELCDVRVLPQLHVLVYGNEKGR